MNISSIDSYEEFIEAIGKEFQNARGIDFNPLSRRDQYAAYNLLFMLSQSDEKEEFEFYIDAINVIGGASHDEEMGFTLFEGYVFHYRTCDHCSKKEHVISILQKIDEFGIETLPVEQVKEAIYNRGREYFKELKRGIENDDNN